MKIVMVPSMTAGLNDDQVVEGRVPPDHDRVIQSRVLRKLTTK